MHMESPVWEFLRLRSIFVLPIFVTALKSPITFIFHSKGCFLVENMLQIVTFLFLTISVMVAQVNKGRVCFELHRYYTRVKPTYIPFHIVEYCTILVHIILVEAL